MRCCVPQLANEAKRLSRMTGKFLIVAVSFLLGANAWASQQPGEDVSSITFVKEFPNSKPDYIAIQIRRDGRAEYRTAPDDEKPFSFVVPEETAAEIFSMAAKMNQFQGANLESKRRVASLGKKTLIYQDEKGNSQASFNHTEVPEAMALTEMFEKISQTQQHYLQLEYLMRFDRLGIVKELLQVEMDLNQDRLGNPSQLIPILDKIRTNDSFMQVAQGRAAQLIEKIQSKDQ